MKNFSLDRKSLQSYLRSRGLYDPVGISVNEIQIHLKADGINVRDEDLRFALWWAGFPHVATVNFKGRVLKVHARKRKDHDRQTAVDHARKRYAQALKS